MNRPAARRPRRLAAPLAPAAIAFLCGIILDRFGPGPDTFVWGVVAVVASLVAMRRPGGLVVFLAFVALGGGRHHLHWTDLDPQSLALAEWSPPRPAWLRGTIVGGPGFHPGEWPDDGGWTLTVLDVGALGDGRDWHPATGRVLVSIKGDRSDLRGGDPVFVAGNLGEIAGPRNPGEVDRRDRARAEGIRLRMSVGEPFSVWPDPEGRPNLYERWLGRTRETSYKLLVSGLDPDVSALGAALLLGRREKVDPDVNDAFARTGTAHLLAISGLHLQALGWLLFFVLTVMGVARKHAFGLVLAATVAYALLVGLMPSVVRSAAMTAIVCGAAMRDRCSSPPNAIAFAAMATMIWNPSYLFDAGCQLSFLAVMALLWGVPAVWPKSPIDPDDEPTPGKRLDALERRLEPRWKKTARRKCRGVVKALLASAVVWLATLPLVALRFHLISPIGVLLNLPLIPMTTLALFFAGLTLMGSTVWTPLGYPTAWICGCLLRGTDWVIARGAGVSWGHTFTPGPSLVWTLGFYALLALAGWASFRLWRGRRLLWVALAIEAALAALVVLWPGRPETLEVDVLAVDHGLAVVIRADDGRTILYDCGKMRDPRAGRRIIAPALWSRGVGRIDTVILSHADSDHFNGLSDLLDRFAVGEVRIPPGFGGSKNPEATRLLARVRSRGVPIREIATGDQLDLGGGRAEVLHPPRGWQPDAPDNARSVVLNLTSGDRAGVLLTGDLEGAGLTELASHPRPAMAAILAPHHGGRTANPEWFYRWADPPRVVVSQKRPTVSARDPLASAVPRGIPIARTWSDGAVQMRFGGARLEARGFLEREQEQTEPRTLAVASLSPLGSGLLGAVVGLALCLVLAIVEWGAWTLVLPGRRLAGPEREPPPWVPIEVVARDGVRLHGARRGANPSGSAMAILLHGFGEDRAAMRGRAESLAARGMDVAILDIRGRGFSEGDRTAFGGREADDFHAWLDLLADRERAGPIVAWGRSMGAAIAARAAVEDPRIVAVILEAPYADLRDAVASWIGRMHLPGLFASPILIRAGRLAGVSLRDPRPIDVAPKVSVPVLILHGTADPVVSPADARRLAAAFAGRVEVIEVDGARHADVFEHGGQDLAERIAAWVSGVAADRPASGTVSPRDGEVQNRPPMD